MCILLLMRHVITVAFSLHGGRPLVVENNTLVQVFPCMVKGDLSEWAAEMETHPNQAMFE